MYAIIRAGGKQAKVREGDVIDVERIKSDTTAVTFTPLLLVNDDGSVVSQRDTLEKSSVTAEIVGESRGPKVDVFTYKNKSGSRRRQGHRQTYTTLQVTAITVPGAKKAATKAAAMKQAAAAAAADAEAKTEPADDAGSGEEE